MEIIWVRPDLLELRFKTSREMLDVTYRFSHYHEYPEWRKKVFTKDDLDNHYLETKGDKDWWLKKWAGANLRDTDIKPFIDGTYGELSKAEQDTVNLVKGLEGSYGVIMTSKQDIVCREHEIAHGLFYLDEKYRTKVTKLIKEYWSELEPVRKLLEEMYDDENMIDELHAYIGVHYKYYLLRAETKVPRKLRRDLVHLYRKHNK